DALPRERDVDHNGLENKNDRSGSPMLPHVARDSESDVVGRYCLYQKTNENGERMIDFCSMNGMFIMNTRFQKRRIHQGTWQHPRTKVWHMKDYVLVNR